ncbi:unnamed protein product [Caenorhabditis bovis]|uniref:Uncharacterized protein n=1 Tax=Caenorhabditis bovis TaxID=2654633 RepID=A0A8S1ESY7_9PELO|nr:unnamed protein product [Caenorhabditis bovis]
MATIIRNFFRGKKSSKKEDSADELAREVSNRRSFRAGSAKSSRRMTARFADDGMLSATAAYHTNNAPKLRKGPQSCPGGYRDESPCSNNSYESDVYSTKSRQRDNVLNQSMRQNQNNDENRPMGKSNRQHHRYENGYRRRGDTSEYGSDEMWPEWKNERHSHYDQRLNESENDDFDVKEQIALMERSNRNYRQKWKESEQKRREEKKKYKELERERNDMQNAMFSYMRQADQLKKEKDKYKQKLRQMENQLNELRQQQFAQMNFNAPFNFCSSNQTRVSAFLPVTSNTPTTMNSTGGAGESLVQPGDMSMLQFQPMSVPSLNLNSTLGNSPHFKPNHFEDDEDEVKNFRAEELTIETARAPKAEPEAISSSSGDSSVTLSEETVNKENRGPLRALENTTSRSFSIMSI